MAPTEESAGTNTSGNRMLKVIGAACIGSALFVAFSDNLSTSRQPVDYSKELPPAMPKGYGTFHQSGFGGIYNVGHPAGARARRHLTEGNTIIPVSAVEHAIPSLAPENIENLHGHYFHDEHRSPFASFLYDRPKEELMQEQADYTAKMNKVRDEWGAWNFVDSTTSIRPMANYDHTPYKDMKNKDFPANSWQKDPKYVEEFIGEAKKLITRVREGLFAEYGHATKDLKTPEEIAARDKLFEVHIADALPATGMAYITEKGFQMLVRKLLHAMITNDEFYFIMGGHSAAAGHGNNFQQQYTMQFNKIMEPVFHKLGMRLISRNLAMGGLGTTHFSCGSATLYGEADFFTWDSSMTEKERADIDLFHKQGLLGKERVPILFGGVVGDLEVETGGDLWYGAEVPNFDFFPLTTGIDQVETLPYATRYMRCDPSVVSMCGSRGLDKYHCSCWEKRTDVETQTKIGPQVGGQASWHPGDREHQAISRRKMMLFLNAFDAALDMWTDGIKKDGFPLNESYWHVGEIYTQFQAKFSSYLNNEGLGKTRCEERWGAAGLSRICRISMRGMTEWTPHSPAGNLIDNIKAAPNGYKPTKIEPLYEGIDVTPQIHKIPDGEIDLHAIAIATDYAPPELDQSFVDDNDEDAEEAENTRRMLKRSISRKIESVTETVAEDVTANETIAAADETTDGAGLAVELEATETAERIVPGIGWMLEKDRANHDPTGFCDGSSMSMCQRSPTNNCLLSGHNDNRSCITGNALSGWLIIKIPAVKEGLIFAKLQWWSPRRNEHPLTDGWTEVNNGETFGHRELKAPPIDWPRDFELDIAINGKIMKTWTYNEFKPLTKEITYNEAFYKFVDDPELAFIGGTPGPVEFGMRIRSTENPRNAAFGVSHLYYA